MVSLNSPAHFTAHTLPGHPSSVGQYEVSLELVFRGEVPVADGTLAGLSVDPDVVPEAGAIPERLGADRAGELVLGVRQALGEFKCPNSGRS